MVHTLPKLKYEYNALEPHIDEQTMKIHHTKHHQTYVDKLNAALKGTAYEDVNVNSLLKDFASLPAELKPAVRNHGGGHANHTHFWSVLSPKGGGEPTGAIADAIAKTFGSYEEFKNKFSAVAAGVFGSGWAWLVKDEQGLKIVGMPNQDSPLMEGRVPLLGLDVWEHSYYLLYQNKRPDYILAFWNLIDWAEVERRYKEN